MKNELYKPPSLWEAFLIWLKVGLLSFGGPAAQISLMHRLVVSEKQWLSEKQYLNGLSFCMLLPGPEAMQLATYVGWRLQGVVGGLLAGLLFVFPGAIVIALLAWLYALYGEVPLATSLFIGIKAAVIVVVLEALFRVSKKALGSTDQWVVALLSFVGIFFFNLPYPLIVVLAALYGFFCKNESANTDLRVLAPTRSMLINTCKTVMVWLLIWSLPLLALFVYAPDSLLLQVGTFFSRLAVVTFGGAYAVLAYLGQEVVQNYGWLSTGEMMDGLGLAETTPGPLILVTEFVGFFAGYRDGGLGVAFAAALLTLWVTFVPCFLWIFAGAPYIEWISDQPRLKGALSAITAAVVGVIANLSLWFALHVMFHDVTRTSWGPMQLWIPNLLSVNWIVLFLTGLCSVAAFKFHWPILRVIVVSSALGLFITRVV